MNLLDRALKAVGLKRRTARSFYQGAEISRVTADWLGQLATPDAELRGELKTLRARSRDLCRNNAHAAALKRVWVDNIVGHDGLQHFPQVKNARGKLNIPVNNKLRAWWKVYGQAGNPTIDGRYSWADLERMVVGSEFEDGEFLALKVYGPDAGPHGFALQLLDPEQLDVAYTLATGPNGFPVRMGVEITPANRPRGYWLWETTPGDILPTRRLRHFVPADHVVHYFEPKRPGQTRGAPRLTPVMYGFKMEDGYEDAEIMAARLSALAALLFEQDPDYAVESPDGKVQGATPVKWEVGMSKLLPPGVKATMMAPTHPTTAFESFTRAIRRKQAAGVGVAYHTMTGDLSQSNYVSMRGGDLQQRDVYRAQQRRLSHHFTEPLYGEAIKASLLAGTLDLPFAEAGKYTAVDFEGRGWPWTNPVQDLAAASAGLALGVETRSGIARSQGNTYEDLLAEREQDDTLEAKYGQEFVDPTPQGVTASLSPATSNETNTDANPPDAAAAPATPPDTTGGADGNQP